MTGAWGSAEVWVGSLLAWLYANVLGNLVASALAAGAVWWWARRRLSQRLAEHTAALREHTAALRSHKDFLRVHRALEADEHAQRIEMLRMIDRKLNRK